MLYGGIEKIMNSSWTAAGYLGSAKNFVWLYQWFASPAILPLINHAVVWFELLAGALLILGLFTRTAAWLSALLMLLFYFVMPFPHQDANSFIVNSQLVYALAFIVLATFRAGSAWGLERKS